MSRRDAASIDLTLTRHRRWARLGHCVPPWTLYLVAGAESWTRTMDLTVSWERVFPIHVRRRYEFREVRNAAGTLAGTSPDEFADLIDVLTTFTLTLNSLTDPGRNKGMIARQLDSAFRSKGWREAGHESKTVMKFTLQPFNEAGETEARVQTYEFHSGGHKVDNVRGRVALDVEWNAKDGNLDRDLQNFRALHDVGLIDVGVILTRHHERTKYAANRLATLGNVVRVDSRTGKRIVLLGTTTTTNLEKLEPRLARGEGGGCPVLAIAMTELCYVPGPGDPQLPPYSPLATVPDASAEEIVQPLDDE